MGNKRYDLVVSIEALASLDAHIEFLAGVSVGAARKVAEEILADIESLTILPERCPPYDNPFVPDNRYRKLLSAKRYLIVFEITEDTVYVDAILDGRQDNTNL